MNGQWLCRAWSLRRASSTQIEWRWKDGLKPTTLQSSGPPFPILLVWIEVMEIWTLISRSPDTFSSVAEKASMHSLRILFTRSHRPTLVLGKTRETLRFIRTRLWITMRGSASSLPANSSSFQMHSTSQSACGIGITQRAKASKPGLVSVQT